MADYMGGQQYFGTDPLEEGEMQGTQPTRSSYSSLYIKDLLIFFGVTMEDLGGVSLRKLMGKAAIWDMLSGR